MSGIFDTTTSNTRSVLLPTKVKIVQDELEYWTNMTCLYDKNWEFDPKLATTPLCFMHVLSITETITAIGAEKRVIVYEAPKTADSPGVFTGAVSSIAAHPAYKNNLEVIMDNVVVKPKQYQMDVLIADSLIGPYITQGIRRLVAMADFMDMRHGDRHEQGWINSIQSGLSTVQGVVDSVDRLAGAIGASAQMATINKNSLEAMASAGHVCLFKKWTGYDFAYGILTKVDIAKKPSERGVSRGTLTFQETPVLNITQKDTKGGASTLSSWASTLRSVSSSAARYANLALAYPFILMTGVLGEAGSVGSEGPGSTLGSWNVFK